MKQYFRCLKIYKKPEDVTKILGKDIYLIFNKPFNMIFIKIKKEMFLIFDFRLIIPWKTFLNMRKLWNQWKKYDQYHKQPPSPLSTTDELCTLAYTFHLDQNLKKGFYLQFLYNISYQSIYRPFHKTLPVIQCIYIIELWNRF